MPHCRNCGKHRLKKHQNCPGCGRLRYPPAKMKKPDSARKVKYRSASLSRNVNVLASGKQMKEDTSQVDSGSESEIFTRSRLRSGISKSELLELEDNGQFNEYLKHLDSIRDETNKHDLTECEEAAVSRANKRHDNIKANEIRQHLANEHMEDARYQRTRNGSCYGFSQMKKLKPKKPRKTKGNAQSAKDKALRRCLSDRLEEVEEAAQRELQNRHVTFNDTPIVYQLPKDFARSSHELSISNNDTLHRVDATSAHANHLGDSSLREQHLIIGSADEHNRHVSMFPEPLKRHGFMNSASLGFQHHLALKQIPSPYPSGTYANSKASQESATPWPYVQSFQTHQNTNQTEFFQHNHNNSQANTSTATAKATPALTQPLSNSNQSSVMDEIIAHRRAQIVTAANRPNQAPQLQQLRQWQAGTQLHTPPITPVTPMLPDAIEVVERELDRQLQESARQAYVKSVDRGQRKFASGSGFKPEPVNDEGATGAMDRQSKIESSLSVLRTATRKTVIEDSEEGDFSA